jgi:predicted DNA-binding transcriptional regulator AlpA
MTTDLPAVEPIEIRLDETTIDRLVERLTESLTALEEAKPVVPDEPEKMLSAAEVAERWGVDRSWVYQHSHQLGAIPMGNGRRPRPHRHPRNRPHDTAAHGPRSAPIVRDPTMCFHFAFTKSIFAIASNISGRAARQRPRPWRRRVRSPPHFEAYPRLRAGVGPQCLSAISSVSRPDRR